MIENVTAALAAGEEVEMRGIGTRDHRIRMTYTSNIGLCSITAFLVATNLAIAGQDLSRLGPADHPPPGTTIVRFGEVAPGIYRGSNPHTDADFRFLRSKHIRYDLD